MTFDKLFSKYMMVMGKTLSDSRNMWSESYSESNWEDTYTDTKFWEY